jgi:hypothetical protein
LIAELLYKAGSSGRILLFCKGSNILLRRKGFVFCIFELLGGDEELIKGSASLTGEVT